MRARPLTALTAILTATFVSAGCAGATVEPKAQAKASLSNAPEEPTRPTSEPDTSTTPVAQPTPVTATTRVAEPTPDTGTNTGTNDTGTNREPVPTPDTATIATEDQERPSAGFDGLQGRVQQATDEAAANGATLSVAVLDRKTHELVANGNTQIVATASVVKLFIADDLLLQESEGKVTLSAQDRQAMDLMLESSDDDAAEKFWNQDGGDAIITQIASRYGLSSTTPPSDGRWWNTMSSLNDLVHYYDMLLDGSGGLPAERARIIVNDLAQSTPNGIDGYPQRFGIPEALWAQKVAVKQGWMCCIGSAWIHLSTGVIGADRRYIMVVQSLQTSDDATARDTITRAVRTIFPNGRIGSADNTS